jgi:hypothetical protein
LMGNEELFERGMKEGEIGLIEFYVRVFRE